ncbi:hypothetical protein QZH41_005443 [Actinostola sp. cb2023]|nr:hypothetical protein QZH41_005443 [Actinostola sp. cb2023]
MTKYGPLSKMRVELGNFEQESIEQFTDTEGNGCSYPEYLRNRGLYASRTYVYLLTTSVDESSRNDQTGEDEAMVLDGTSQPPNSDLNPNSAFDDANECLDRDEAAKDVPSPTLGVAKVGEEYSTVDFCEHTLNIQYENHKESSYSEVIIRTVSSSIAQCYDHNSFENPFIRETAVDDYDPLDNGYTVSGISKGHASFLQEVFNPTNDDPNETVSDVSFVFPQANHTENGPLILHSPSEVWGYDNNKLILGVVTSYHNEPGTCFTWYHDGNVLKKSSAHCCLPVNAPGEYRVEVQHGELKALSEPVAVCLLRSSTNKDIINAL